MKEDVNVRIIRKIKESDYDEKLKQFLINMIKEEFQNEELYNWDYARIYEQNIKKYSH